MDIFHVKFFIRILVTSLFSIPPPLASPSVTILWTPPPLSISDVICVWPLTKPKQSIFATLYLINDTGGFLTASYSSRSPRNYFDDGDDDE